MARRSIPWQESPRYARAKEQALARLRHAAEQIEKDQHLTAQAAMADALRDSMRCFAVVRHGEDVGTIVARFSRYGSPDEQGGFFTFAEAAGFLAYGESECNLTAHGGELRDELTGRVVAGDELDQLVATAAAKL